MEVFRTALAQAKEGRMVILNHMLGTIAQPRPELNRNAPRMIRIMIPVDKIGAVIGPGGKTIRGIIEQTGATIDIDDDGSVTIGATDADAAQAAIRIVEGLTKDVEVGQRYTGKVSRLMNFGAFVEILPGKEGLVHISELDTVRVGTVEDVVKVGDEVEVMVIEIDRMGRINLSRRAVLEGADPEKVAASAASRNGGGERGGDRGGDRGPRRPGGGDRDRRPMRR
jgi:polyribonucleotide nucleotidyltransferase